jgi:hypothetical protein
VTTSELRRRIREALARRSAGARAALLGVLLAALPALEAPAQLPGAATPPAATFLSPPLAGRALVGALRSGGYVIYLRHTSTDFGQNDDAMTSFADCAQQRNLTERGRAEARAIGAALRALHIPLGAILASPFCRTLETARLAFGEPTTAMAVRGGPIDRDNPDRYAELRTIFATAPPPGTNIAIASHGNPYQAVVGPPYLAEGEMAIIRPLGDARFEVVARVRKEEWAELARP